MYWFSVILFLLFVISKLLIFSSAILCAKFEFLIDFRTPLRIDKMFARQRFYVNTLCSRRRKIMFEYPRYEKFFNISHVNLLRQLAQTLIHKPRITSVTDPLIRPPQQPTPREESSSSNASTPAVSDPSPPPPAEGSTMEGRTRPGMMNGSCRRPPASLTSLDPRRDRAPRLAGSRADYSWSPVHQPGSARVLSTAAHQFHQQLPPLQELPGHGTAGHPPTEGLR